MADNRFTNKARALERMRRIPLQVRIAARKQLNAEGERLVNRIRPRIPVDDGHENGDVPPLNTTIRSYDASGQATAALSRLKVIVVEGEGQEEKARANEFGRGGLNPMEPQPHFFPTYRAERKGIKRRMSTAITKAVRKLFPK